MSKFIIEVCSDLDCEEMVVDIADEDGRIVTMNSDKGIENTEIAIFGKEDETPILSLNYLAFTKALEEAFQTLKEVNSKE